MMDEPLLCQEQSYHIVVVSLIMAWANYQYRLISDEEKMDRLLGAPGTSTDNGSLEIFRSRSMWWLSIHGLHSLKYPGNGWKLYRESEKQGKFDQSCAYLLLIFPCHFRQAPIIQRFPGFWLVRLQVYSTAGPIFLLHLSRWQFLVTLAPVQILVWSGASHATQLFLLGIIEVSEEWDSKRVSRGQSYQTLTHSEN